MSIADFNRGLDDAYTGTFRHKYLDNSDYIEGLEYGEDIEREHDYEEAVKKDYEEYMRKKQEEDFKDFKEVSHHDKVKS